MRIAYSPVNQAWFLLWHDQVISIFATKAEANAELDYCLRK